MSTPSTTPASTSDPSTSLTTPASEDDRICTKEHALYCFDNLVDHFYGTGVKATFHNKDDKYALFVSYHTNGGRAGRKPSLRGCIGNFRPSRLADGLAEYALTSALEDGRFSPIQASELPNLSCDVSLLTPFEKVDSPLSWTPGQHGIYLTFPHPTSGKELHATYLPEICPEQRWTREQTVLSAIAKAGYRGRVTVGDALWDTIETQVYESVKAGVTWDEYLAWKRARGERVPV
ncbi:hypothetical protein IAU60_002523 [Kwoniella sp. DSM 27419]